MATRSIDIQLALTGEKSFNDQMKAVNSNLKTLKSEMAVVSSEFKGNEGSVEALTAKQRVLAQQVDQQKAKLKALAEMHAEVASKQGEDSAAADRLKQQVNQATVELNRMTAALEETSSALSEQQQYVNVFDRLKGKASEFAEAGRSAVDSVKGFINSKPGLSELAAVGGAVATGLKKAVPVAAELAGHVAKLGVNAAAATVKFGAKAFAGAIAATAVAATAGVVALTKFANEAAESARAAAEAGETLTPTQEKWLEYSNTLSSLDTATGAAKAALGGILLPVLGELGTQGAQLLTDFSAAMEATEGDTEKMGEVMSEYIQKALEMVKASLPMIKETAKDLLSGLSEGFSENGDEILDTAMEIVTELIDGLIAAAPALGTTAGELIVTLASHLVEQGPSIVEAGLQLLLGLLTGFAEALPQLIESLPDMMEKIKNTLIELAPKFAEVGSQIVGGIWEGIKSAWESLTSWVVDKFHQLIGTVKADQEIASPSRKWARVVGKPIGQGIGKGFDEAMKDVRADIDAQLDPESFPKGVIDFTAVARRVTGTETGGASGGTYSAGGSSGASAEAIAQAVIAAMGEMSIDVNVKNSFEGSLAGLARVLQPAIEAEVSRRGPNQDKVG